MAHFSINLKDNSILFTFSRLYWISGFMTLIISLRACLKRVITNKPFTPEYFMDLIDRHQITHTFINPNQLSEINKVFDIKSGYRLRSLDTILCGGSKVSENAITKFNELLGDVCRPGLTVGYGLTESVWGLVMNDEGPGKRKAINGGRLVPNACMRIIDKTGNNLGINEQGIIYFKLSNDTPGYMENPKATEEAYINGWFKTGDLGYFDKDGYLTVIGRDSDTFWSNMFLISPPHIEEVIMQLDGVLEVCIFGIPDDGKGHLIACAVVVTNDDTGKQLKKSDIEMHVMSSMDKIFHINGGVYFMDSLPHSASGKILRRKVPDLIKEKNNSCNS